MTAGDGSPEPPCRLCDVARDLWARAAGAARQKTGGDGDAQSSLTPLSPGAAWPPPPPPALPVEPAGPAAVAGEEGGGRRADCLGCRVTGLMAGLGGAGYLSSRLLEEPPPRGAHRAALLASSAVLAGLGLARGFGWY
jgi:hypothetical protein